MPLFIRKVEDKGIWKWFIWSIVTSNGHMSQMAELRKLKTSRLQFPVSLSGMELQNVLRI
jgi:hypothetical protein